MVRKPVEKLLHQALTERRDPEFNSDEFLRLATRIHINSNLWGERSLHGEKFEFYLRGRPISRGKDALEALRNIEHWPQDIAVKIYL